MAWGEPAWKRQQRLQRQEDQYPELAGAPPEIVMAVDQMRARKGETLTSLGQAAEREYVTGWADQSDPYRAGLSKRGVKVARGASEAQYGGRKPSYEVQDTLARALQQGDARAIAGETGSVAARLPGAFYALSGGPIAMSSPLEGKTSGWPRPLALLAEEATRPINYIGAPIRAAAFAPKAGLAGRVLPDIIASAVGRGAGEQTAARLEGQPAWLQSTAAVLAGLVAGGGAGVASARAPQMLRGAGTYARDVARAANAPLPLRPGDAQLNMGIPRKVPGGEGLQHPNDLLGQKPPYFPPVRERELAAFKAKWDKELAEVGGDVTKLSKETRDEGMALLGRALAGGEGKFTQIKELALEPPTDPSLNARIAANLTRMTGGEERIAQQGETVSDALARAREISPGIVSRETLSEAPAAGPIRWDEPLVRGKPTAEAQAAIQARLKASRAAQGLTDEGETLAGSIPGGPQLSRAIGNLFSGAPIQPGVSVAQRNAPGAARAAALTPESVFRTAAERTATEAVRAAQVPAGVGNTVADVLNVPRSLMASLDLSGTLRQGGMLAPSRPRQFAAAVRAQAQALVSDDAARAVDDAIRAHPSFPLAERAGLYLAPLDNVAQLGAREEQFMSKLAGGLPGVKQTQRAYVTMLNKLRADTFYSIVNKWGPEDLTDERLARLGGYLNAATGRGDLPGLMKQWAPFMNAAFFSPRFLVSRVQANTALIGAIKAGDTKVAGEIARDLVGFYTTGVLMLGAAAAAGAQVESNPISSDFGKIRIGNTRYDIWAGNQQLAKTIAQIALGQRKTTNTGEVVPLGRVDALLGFLENKLSPIAGTAVDLSGKGQRPANIQGPMDVVKIAAELLTPITAAEIAKGIKDEGWLGAVKQMPALLGVGVGTFGGEPKDVAAKAIYDADQTAWKAVATEYERDEQSFADWRENAIKRVTERVRADEKFMAKHEGAGSNELEQAIRSEALRVVNAAPAAKLYEKYQTNLRVTWAAQHIEDGLADAALGARKLTVTEMRKARELYQKRKPKTPTAKPVPAGAVRG